MQRVEARLAEAWPPDQWHDLTVLLAVSGGADSVALVRAMAAIDGRGEGRLVVGHVHHGLRGHEADRDQQAVEALSRKLHLACHVGRADVARRAALEGDGLEAAARSARYRLLRETAERIGARYVVTAHTADDQIETILHHIVRGTGLAGLSGMARARPLGAAVTLIRPLLTFRRAELRQYLRALGQEFREDVTNRDLRLTRNRIRHELLPHLKSQYNKGVGEALLRLGDLARQAQSVIGDLVGDLADRCVLASSDRGATIDCRPLVGAGRYVVRELLVRLWRERTWPEQAMDYARWGQLTSLAMADCPPQKHRQQMFPGAILARREGDTLVLFRNDS